MKCGGRISFFRPIYFLSVALTMNALVYIVSSIMEVLAIRSVTVSSSSQNSNNVSNVRGPGGRFRFGNIIGNFCGDKTTVTGRIGTTSMYDTI